MWGHFCVPQINTQLCYSNNCQNYPCCSSNLTFLLLLGSSAWRQIGFIQFQLIWSVTAVNVFSLPPSCLPTHPPPFMSSHPPPPFMSSFHLTLHSSRPNTTGHKSIPSVDIVRNYLPDVVVFLITVVTMAIMAHLSKEVSNTEAEPQQTIEGERMLQTSAEQGLVLPNPPSDTKPTSDHCWVVAHGCLDLAIFVMTGACGVSVPSLTSMVYFLLFLLRATLWALHFDRWTRLWSAVRVLLLIYTGCHLVMVYLYQFEKAQELIPLQPTNTTSSLLGRWVSSGSYLLVVREGGGVMAVRDVYT